MLFFSTYGDLGGRRTSSSAENPRYRVLQPLCGSIYSISVALSTCWTGFLHLVVCFERSFTVFPWMAPPHSHRTGHQPLGMPDSE
jgi:hypothetical protein